MIKNDQELQVTFDRIQVFQRHVAQLRSAEKNAANFACQLEAFWPKSTA